MTNVNRGDSLTIANIINITNGKVINKVISDNLITEMKIDTRKLNEGDLFIAIKGNNYNGHDYIKQAVENKVCGIIIDEDIKIPKTKIPIIKVESTYDALILIATHIRLKHDVPLIAVTGSVGKTTTKELIYDILSNKYNVLKNIDNNNNHIGLPLTLFRLKDEHDIIVTELGMNHFGEIKRLSNICKPNVSVITNIGTSHIGNLGSKKGIFKAKMEILDGMKKGILVINGDDKYLKKVKNNKRIEIYKCGTKNNNHLKAQNIKCYFDKTTFDVKIDGNIYEITFNVPGRHLINNVLLALQIGIFFNVDINDMIESIKNYQSVDKRMSIIKLDNNITLIEDCYNSSYESLIGVLELIKDVKTHKLIILGDILELGKYSRKIHLKVGKYLKKIKNSTILLVGNEINVVKKKSQHFTNNNELIDYLNNISISDTIILIKGSRRLHLEEIKAYFQKRY